MTGDTARRVATARRWFELLGQDIVDSADATIAVTPDHPDIWEGNFAYAKPSADPAALIAALDRAMAHTKWRVVLGDVLTDPPITAALALADFAPNAPNIEMLAEGEIAARHPPAAITLHQVETSADWDAMTPLIRADHAEGKRTGPISGAVGDALIAMMRLESPRNSYSLLMLEGEPVGYGMAVACPGGLGVLEHLFCRPDRRGRGVMSAYIIEASARLRNTGCDAIFLDALSGETAKHLYAGLGFVPVATTCRWTRQIGD